MVVIRSGIKKEEIILPNNQKLIIEYTMNGPDPVPEENFSLSDMIMAMYRRLSLFDESGKLIGTNIEENPHKVKASPGVHY